MKKWIKFFGLSFFSNGAAQSAPRFGFGSALLSLALALLFLLFGYYGADVVPFGNRYQNAGEYRAFIRNAVDGLDLEIEGGAAITEKKINTYTDEADKAAYGRNGYNFIADTRPADMLIRFTQVAVKGGSETDYETYLALGEKEREGYTLETRYTDEELVITREAVTQYEAYLSETEGAEEAYAALDRSAEDYGEQLYYLYVKHYYHAVTSVMYGANAPVLRDYYYRYYIADGNAYYFYIFRDMCAGSFETDGGVPAVFGGYFNQCADGKVTDIDGLVVKAFYDTAGNTFISYVMSALSQLPMLVFIPLFFGLLMWLFGKAVKGAWEKTFAGCYKTVCSFVWCSALITSLALFVGGFATAAQLIYPFIPLSFGGVLLVRTVVFCAEGAVKNKKQLAESRQNKSDDIFGGIL